MSRPPSAELRARLAPLVALVRARAHEVHRDSADVVLTPGAVAWTLKGTTIRGTGNHHPLNVLPQLLAGVPHNEIADQFIDGWRRRIRADEKARCPCSRSSTRFTPRH